MLHVSSARSPENQILTCASLNNACADAYIGSNGQVNSCHISVLLRKGNLFQLLQRIALNKQYNDVLLYKTFKAIEKKLPPGFDKSDLAGSHLLIMDPAKLCKLLQIAPLYNSSYYDDVDRANPTPQELVGGQLAALK